jgi:CRISPR/Cas system-associated exonuclease Cas4 (RecB family)
LLYLKQNPKEYIRRTRVNYTEQTLEIVGQRITREAKEMLSDPAIYPTPSQWNCNGCRYFQPCVATQEGRDADIILQENYVVRV